MAATRRQSMGEKKCERVFECWSNETANPLLTRANAQAKGLFARDPTLIAHHAVVAVGLAVTLARGLLHV